MKALLTQWIGGGQIKGKGDIMSAAGSGSQKMKGDTAGADGPSFMGLMMGFLGMNEKSAPAANGEGAVPSEFNKEEEKKSADGASVPGMSGEVSGKINAKEIALTEVNKEGKKTADGAIDLGMLDDTSVKDNGKAVIQKSAESEVKNKTNPMPAAEKLKTRPGHQKTESDSAAASSAAGYSESIETQVKNTDAAKGEETAETPTEVKKGDTNVKGKVNINVKSAETSSDNAPRPLKTKGEAVEGENIKVERRSSGERLPVLENVAAKGNNVKPAAGRVPEEGIKAPVIDTTSAVGKEQATSKQPPVSQMQAENTVKQSAWDMSKVVNEGKKNPVIAADLIKKVQQKEEKNLKIKTENGRTPETSVRRPLAQGSQSSPVSAQNSEPLLRKADFNVKSFMPGKMVSPDAPGKVQAEADPAFSKDAGSSPEKSFKEIHLNEFRSTSLTETGGRRKFSKYLGEVGRQQAAGESRETARQQTQWKHHRFVMKDGKALNISARSADGALQLQLNAGSGELGKVLHRHLQEIRQHVQQELNIKIDLQLQDFSGRQSEQQHESGSSSSEPTSSSSPSGESSRMAISATSKDTERVRYFGFNNNEWTA